MVVDLFENDFIMAYRVCSSYINLGNVQNFNVRLDVI